MAHAGPRKAERVPEPTAKSTTPSNPEIALSSDPELALPGKRRRSRVDVAAARFTFFHQEGQGYQSQAGPIDGPGSEQIYVYQAMGAVGIQTGDRLRNDVVMMLDVVTAASPDALDATTSASRTTEAGDVRTTTSYRASRRDTLRFVYGGHAEEHWWGGRAGMGYQRSLADDNATLDISINGVLDYFDDLQIDGYDEGEVPRWTANANLGYTQVLSPTTLAAASYGVTFQTGRLETTWNSVPGADEGRPPPPSDVPGRVREQFPGRRLRHAFFGQLLQHIPRTRSTIRGSYRFYFDDVGLLAHTASLAWYQWLNRRMYVRTAYRLHHQTGVDFFETSVRPSEFDAGSPITADSDLSRFFAHELGAKVVVYLRPPGSAQGAPQFVDLGYRYYWRTNTLRVDVISLGYGGNF